MPISNISTVFLDTRPKAFPGLEVYFEYSKFMPLGTYSQDLYVEKAQPMPTMSLFDLALDMPGYLKPGQNAVIYSHACPDNFYFPVDSKKPKNDFDIKEAANLSYHLDLIERDQLGIIDPFLAAKYAPYVDPLHKKNFKDGSPDYLKLSKGYDDFFMSSMRAIRAMKINHLAIRACRIGLNTDFMRILGRLFGAKSVSAPKLRTASVLGSVMGIAKHVATEQQRKDFYATKAQFRHGIGGMHCYTYPNRRNPKEPHFLVFQHRKVPQSEVQFQLLNFNISSTEALGEFLRQTAGYDALLPQVLANGKVAFHALQGPTALIFPGEREYLQNIAFVTV